MSQRRWRALGRSSFTSRQRATNFLSRRRHGRASGGNDRWDSPDPGTHPTKTDAHIRRGTALKVHDEPKRNAANEVIQHRAVAPRPRGRLLVHRGRTRTHYRSLEADGQGQRHHFCQRATIPAGQGGYQPHLDGQLAADWCAKPSPLNRVPGKSFRATLPCNGRHGSTARWLGTKHPEIAQKSRHAGPLDVFG